MRLLNIQLRERLQSGNRRKFVKAIVKGTATFSLMSFLLGGYAKLAQSRPASELRPPGAITENDFLGACVRCGLCVRDCPYDTLKLAPFGASTTPGTPYFVAKEIPCEMCEDIPCVVACPTGALDSLLDNIKDARMGLAVVTGTDTCVSMNGSAHCEACYLACPVKDKAISMILRQNNGNVTWEPIVDYNHCTGCGKCEKDCVVPDAAIKVLPLDVIKRKVNYDYL